VGHGSDIAMLRYTLDREHTKAFAMVIEHDDAQRESAYSEEDGATLTAAQRYGMHVVSMKRDWRIVFARERRHAD
jgi:hypothetical protein